MGITARNLLKGGGLARSVEYGVNFLIPPNDEQFVVASYPLTDLTADGDFPLAAPIQALGGQLPWPCRLFIVLRNRGLIGTTPNITQVAPPFSGADQLRITINGYLNGKVQTEIVDIIGVTTTVIDADRQREHQVTTKFFDQIISISHANIDNNGFGTTTPLQLSIGLGEAEHGDKSHKLYRMQILAPNQLPQASALRRVAMLSEADPLSNGSDWQKFGAFTSQLAANTLTSAAHGLANGTPIRLTRQSALPSPLEENRTYFVVGTAANTIQLANSIAGAAIDIVATVGYADGDNIIVWTKADSPSSWALGSPLQSPVDISVSAIGAGTTTFTRTAHGLGVGTAFKLATTGTLGSGPWATSASANTLTLNAHGIPNLARVRVVDMGFGVPAPLNINTLYHVVNSAPNTLELSLTSGGATIDITGVDVNVALARNSTMPGGVNANTTYYVIGGASYTANVFQFSTTPGGAAVDITNQLNGILSLSLLEYRAELVLASETLFVPGSVPAPFTTVLGRAAVTVATDLLTLVGHGLVNGNTVRLLSDGDALPGNTALNTTYFVVGVTGTTPDTFQVALTPGGAAIDLTATGDFADAEDVLVLRPTHVWRQGRMIYSDRESVG